VPPLLLVGALAAIVWANIDVASYESAAQPARFWINDVGMVFFLGLAAKEVFEATLPGGALASRRSAASPLAAAVGGMVAPAAIYLALTGVFGSSDLTRGWAIPCATDIAFSAMVARAVFPAGHAAIPFLLLLAVADDALGLIVLAAFYTTGPIEPFLLIGLMAAALLAAFLLRRRGIKSFWPYLLIPGVLSWMALYAGGFHPALALVPVVPFMPHAPSDLGLFNPRKEAQADTLSRFEHALSRPVEVVLLLFGFANAGVPLSEIGAGTYYVVIALLVGKPIGILVATALAQRAGAQLPSGIGSRELAVVGVAASIGFTVSLFFATAAFPPGPALSQTKMGALLSLVAVPIAVLFARVARPKGPAAHEAPRHG
jgi:Na+:H+ antiporter, NhaA family